MTTYVKTDYVPDDCDYLTAGKVYGAALQEHDIAAIIIADDGSDELILLEECCHLNGLNWTICDKDGNEVK